ncbi:hypothetical protein [Desulforhopalus sp. 52FAK]
MKKKIAATVLILGLTMTTAATANWNGQRGNCYLNQMQTMQNVDPAIQEKVKQFHLDNQAIFKEMAMKRAEKRAFMRSNNPDPKAAAQLAGELFDLRTTIQLKAEEAGIAQYIGPMNMGNGKSGRGKNGGRGQQGQQGQMVN